MLSKALLATTCLFGLEAQLFGGPFNGFGSNVDVTGINRRGGQCCGHNKVNVNGCGRVTIEPDIALLNVRIE